MSAEISCPLVTSLDRGRLQRSRAQVSAEIRAARRDHTCRERSLQRSRAQVSAEISAIGGNNYSLFDSFNGAALK